MKTIANQNEILIKKFEKQIIILNDRIKNNEDIIAVITWKRKIEQINLKLNNLK